MTTITKYPNLPRLLFSYAVLLCSNLMKKEKANSPKALGKYVKVENIDKKDNSKLVSLGVYKKNNKYFFIKVWHGRIRDITYYLLLNEFYVSSLLFKKMHGQVSVPKPIETIVTPNCMSFVYQYVNGKQLDKFSKKTQADVVSKIIRELEKKAKILQDMSALSLVKKNTALTFTYLWSFI